MHATPVHSHTSLVRSSPAARAVLTESPTRIELWFAERLEPAYSWMSVRSAATGARVDKEKTLVVGPEDPKRLSVAVFTLRPGEYTVHYRVTSVDGHVLESSFDFKVRARTDR